MKKYLSIIVVIFFLITIKIIPSEQTKRGLILGCYGIQTNTDKSEIYVTNLENEIKKILKIQSNLDNDSTGTVIGYLHYDSVHWDPEERVLIGNISEGNPDNFVSFFPNLNKDIKDQLRLICTTDDKQILKETVNSIKSKLKVVPDQHFFISYDGPRGRQFEKIYYNGSNTSWLQTKVGKEMRTSTVLTIENLKLFDDIEPKHFDKGLPLPCITKNEKDISNWFKNKKTISLKTTFNKIHPHVNIAERLVFNPKEYSPLICLAIASIPFNEKVTKESKIKKVLGYVYHKNNGNR